MMIFMIYKGMNLPEEAKLIGPCLMDKADEIEMLLKDIIWKCGKTVLEVPYATCADSFPAKFLGETYGQVTKEGIYYM